MPHVIVAGNLSEGFRVIGPFEDFDEACGFEESNELGLAWSQSWVMTLENPKEVVNAEADQRKSD